MLINLPNSLTAIRIALIPLFVLVFFLPFPWAHPTASMIFALAGITDWLDGYFARRLDQTSAFGAFLDPVADKLMVVAALVLIVHEAAGAPKLVITLAAIVIIGREIAISALREWMAEMGQRGRVAVSKIGKYKTTFQITALILMLWRYPFYGIPVYEAGIFFLILAAVLTLWSMYVYLRSAWPVLKQGTGPS